ncbi:hypothetical protein CR513_58342, partial [Mucuna pruriens]
MTNLVSQNKIENKIRIVLKGKETIVPKSHSDFKLISNLLEKGYKVLFEHKNRVIKDTNNIEVIKVQIKDKSFEQIIGEEDKNEGLESNEEHKDTCVLKKLDVKESEDADEEPPSNIYQKCNVATMKLT